MSVPLPGVLDRPFLSIVVPAFNEQAVIGRFIDSVRAEVDRQGLSWEAIVVDDGSADDTARIVRDAAKADARVRLVEAPHRGKGAAVREGFLAARGEWVLMADADLSMPWDNLPRFLGVAREPDAPQIVIGSREAPGAERTGEAWSRRVSGRVFNTLVRVFAVPGVRDSQCGYKMLSADAVAALAPHLTVDGFAFDVELLYLARLAGFRIREVGIVCRCRQDSRVRVRAGLASVVDVMRVRLKTRRVSPRAVRPTSYSERPGRPAPASSPDRRRGSSYTP
ncbi:MAG TPA: dolichyl-phosphate beta-glucosyltransferase [Vicinamibacterales bacterium]|jgi:glycosyltransferase involved in cell wall biosynthesis|nr:dolichyl-phosphate beta-glucosyltransferase [Vicinamibacterales bacterium]